MSNELGNKLKYARKKHDFSLAYVGKMINKSESVVSRYENGTIVPDIYTLKELCKLLDIYTGDLFTSDDEHIIVNDENSKNPFGVNRLYLYYLGYKPNRKHTITKYKLTIDIEDKKDFIEIKISSYNTSTIVLIGHMESDDSICTFRTSNYKPEFSRYEANQIILNITGGTDGIVRGVMLCTDGLYVPNMKKVLVSKKDLPFSDEMEKTLKLTQEEIDNIVEDNIWQANIQRFGDFEYKE